MVVSRVFSFVCAAIGILFVAVAGGVVPADSLAADEVASLDPLVILQKECVSCHTEAKRKGGLLIDSRESLLKGGDSGPSIEVGNAKESYLIESLYPDDDNHMPPKGQLKPQEIEALEKWVDAGATWDMDRWVKLNLPPRVEVATGPMPDRYNAIFAIALSPDRKNLAVGSGNTILWYNVIAGDVAKKEAPIRLEYRASSPTHNDSVQAIAFSPDGKTLASGAFRSVRLWSTDAPEKMLREITKPFIGRQTALHFLADGKRLLAADSIPSQLGRLHEITLDPEKVVTFDTAHRDSIFSITLSPDGKQYATTSADKLITVRDTKDNHIVTRLEGHTGYVLTAVFSPEGKRIASGGDEGEVKVWDVASGKKISSFASNRSGPLNSLAWTINPEKGKQKAAEKDAAKAAEINTDLIVSAPQSGHIATFSDLKEHEGQERSSGAREQKFDKVETPLYCLTIDPESLWTLSGGENGLLYLWDDKGKLQEAIDPAQSKAAPQAVASADSAKAPAPPTAQPVP